MDENGCGMGKCMEEVRKASWRGGLSSQVFPKEKELASGRREVVKTKAWVWDTTRKLHGA